MVWQKRSNDPFTFEIAKNFGDRFRMNCESSWLQGEFSAHAVLYPFSYALFSDSLFLEADIVHYHLIHNCFFNLSHLPMLSRLKPTVWTLHDPWAVTGHCVHFFECGRWKHGCGDCPHLGSHFAIKRDTTALNWEMKKQIYSMCKLDIVVLSGWMYEVAKASPLLENFAIHRVPPGLDERLFFPANKAAAKHYFNIPANKKVLAFRATTDELKGLKYIKEVLNRLNVKDVALLTNDHIGLLDEYKSRFQIVDMGWIQDIRVMRNFYSAADLYLMPSQAETFGLSAIEAMACGTPVVSFSGTALTDTIGAPVSGVVVPAGLSEALRSEIEALLHDDERRARLSDEAVKLIRERHGLHGYISRMTDLYREAIWKHGQDPRSAFIVDQLAAIRAAAEKSGEPGQGISLAESMKINAAQGTSLITKMKNQVNRYPRLKKLLMPMYKRMKRQ